MKLSVFAIRDSAVKAFMRPFYARSEAEAVRSVQDVVKDATHPMSAHPEDYELFKLGTFDEDNGMFETGMPSSVVAIKSLVIKGS